MKREVLFYAGGVVIGVVSAMIWGDVWRTMLTLIVGCVVWTLLLYRLGVLR